MTRAPLIACAAILAGCSSPNYQIARFDGVQAAPGEIEQAKEICRGEANFKTQMQGTAPIHIDSFFNRYYKACMAARGFKLTETGQ